MVVAMPNIKNVLTNKFNKDGQDLAIHNRFLRMKYITLIPQHYYNLNFLST